VATDTASVLKDQFHQMIVKQIIENNLEPRIKAKASSLNQSGYAKVMNHIHDKLERMTIEPLTVRRIDELTMELHQEALDLLEQPGGAGEGRMTASAGGRASAPTRGGGPASTKPGFFDIKDEGLPGIAIGMRKEVINSGKVFGIPRGSAMQVYLEIGQDVPLKAAADASDLVQLRCKGGFFSPSGKWYAFPRCILQGKVKANPGGDRNMVAISSISVEVNGIAIEKEMVGIVTDERDGIAGMIAKFDRHLEKVLPEAAILALTQGLAEGLASTQDTTTVVVPGATTQAQQTGNAAQLGIGKGLEKGASILEKYEEGYIDKMSPTLKTWNGQKLVAQFFSTVEFPEISEADWREEGIASGEWNGF
jgi:hypothetical protein